MIVVIKDNGQFVMAVNPFTRRATKERQQFIVTPDDAGYGLQILPREQWIDNPPVLEVKSLYGVSQ